MKKTYANTLIYYGYISPPLLPLARPPDREPGELVPLRGLGLGGVVVEHHEHVDVAAVRNGLPDVLLHALGVAGVGVPVKDIMRHTDLTNHFFIGKVNNLKGDWRQMFHILPHLLCHGPLHVSSKSLLYSRS